MKKLMMFSVSLLLSQAASAGSTGAHIFMCKVIQFDQKEVKGQCDPSRPKNMYKIPREWIAEESPLKVNSRVKFIIDEKQFGEWIAMNKMEMPKGNVK